MKKLFFVPILMFLSGATLVDASPIDFPFRLASPQKLDNGLIVYAMTDSERPVAEVVLRFPMSVGEEDSICPQGLSLMAEAWRTGGNSTMTPSQVDDWLDSKGVQLSIGAGEDGVVVSIRVLTENLNEALTFLSIHLKSPRFDSEAVSVIKAQSLEGWNRRYETLYGVGRRAVRNSLFGKTHVYSRQMTPADLKRISIRDLRKLHKHLLNVNGAILSISGQMEETALASAIGDHFSKFPSFKRTPVPFRYAPIDPNPAPAVYVTKDATQARVVLARLGPARNDPRELAYFCASEILGGGGSSELFGEVRARQGLAYMVASFVISMKGTGFLGAVAQTKAPSTQKAIHSIMIVMERFSKGSVSNEEIERAKTSLKTSFVFQFKSYGDLVRAQANSDFEGYPADYLSSYLNRVEKLEKSDITGVGAFFDPKQMKVVVVGPESESASLLKEFPGGISLVPSDLD